MTSTATPSLNPEPPLAFGAGNAFASESRRQAHPFNQTAPLATDETQMEHGLGAENYCSRPRFYSSPARNQFVVPIRQFRPFPICVYSVFHPWQIELHSPDSFPKLFSPADCFAPLRLSPFALNPFRLIEETRCSAVDRWLPKNIRYYKLLKAIITWRKWWGGVPLVKNQQSRPSRVRWGETPGEPP
jgi:hypothetical protein